MSKLEPGMLALVIGCKNNPVNIGKSVTLEAFVKAGDRFVLGKARRDSWHVSGNGLSCLVGDEIVVGSDTLVASEHLLPIKPESDPLETKQEQELHA